METIKPGAKLFVLETPEQKSVHIIPAELLSWPDRRGPAHGIALCGYRYTSETEVRRYWLIQYNALNAKAIIDPPGAWEMIVSDKIECDKCREAYTKLFNR